MVTIIWLAIKLYSIIFKKKNKHSNDDELSKQSFAIAELFVLNEKNKVAPSKQKAKLSIYNKASSNFSIAYSKFLKTSKDNLSEEIEEVTNLGKITSKLKKNSQAENN